ncbi:MAG TPA: uridine kinase [Bacteroides sp.]|nr:uridine kinase [Bacteroides sp.]
MLVVGIAGGSGSGKTTVVKRIMERLPENDVAILPQDAYYYDNSQLDLAARQEVNFDHPDSLEFPLIINHIDKLRSGKNIERPVYTYITCTRSDETINMQPRKVIILEGILIFTHAALRDIIDIKVFVDADADDRLGRIISRDIQERGRSVNKVLDRYEKTVKPMHLQFIEPSKRYADIIVPQGGNNLVAIDILSATILKKLEAR